MDASAWTAAGGVIVALLHFLGRLLSRTGRTREDGLRAEIEELRDQIKALDERLIKALTEGRGLSVTEPRSLAEPSGETRALSAGGHDDAVPEVVDPETTDPNPLRR